MTNNTEQSSIAGVWVKANERLPEFENKDKKYVCRYINSTHPIEVWSWDIINNHFSNSLLFDNFKFEWLDESVQQPPLPQNESYWEERCKLAEYLIAPDAHILQPQFSAWQQLKSNPAPVPVQQEEKEIVEKILNVGHNDDCLFCGFKDRLAIDYLKINNADGNQDNTDNFYPGPRGEQRHPDSGEIVNQD